MIRVFQIMTALVFSTAVGFADAPKVKTNYEVSPGQMVRVTIETEKEIGMVTSFTEEQAFFEELSPKPKSKRFVFQSFVPGIYVVAIWNIGEATGTLTTITVKDPNPNPKPTPTPTPVPPPVKTTTYFYIIRPDGPAQKDFTDIMSLPAWNELAKQGYQYGVKTALEARTAGYQIPTPLPAFYILKIADGKSKIDGPPIKLPTTNETILAMPKGVN